MRAVFTVLLPVLLLLLQPVKAQKVSLLKDMNSSHPSPLGSNPKSFFQLAPLRAIFVAESPFVGQELWPTDSSGTRLLKDIWPGPSGSSPRG